MRRKSLLAILIGFVIAALFYWGFSSLYSTPEESYPASSTIRLLVPGGERIDSPLIWYTSASMDASFRPGIYESILTVTIPDEGAQLDPEARYSLVLPYIGGSAIEVRMNGEWVGSHGDMAEGRSSIWNAAKIFSLRPGLVRTENRVEISIRAIYEAGIIRTPYIINGIRGRNLLMALRFASDSAIWMCCGAIIIMGLAIIIMGFVHLPAFDERILLGAACVIAGIFLTDFVNAEYLFLPLLEFKRLVATLRHVAAILLTAGCLRLLGRKTDWFARIFMVVQGVCAVMILFPRTMIDMKRLYDWTYLTVLPLQFYLFYLMAGKGSSAPGYRFVLFGVSIGVIASLRDAIAAFLWPDAVLVAHYGFMFLILSVTGYVIADMADRNRQLLLEKRRAERYREASMRDPLTGAYNRNIIPLVLENLEAPFALVAIDMDGLKSINDRYGHLAGDRILEDFVSTAKRLCREDDRIVRVGGDEFLVILPGSSEKLAGDLAARLEYEVSCARISVCAECADSPPLRPEREEGSIIRYSVSLGIACHTSEGDITMKHFDEAVATADARLYLRKTARAGIQ